jgi:3-deoxy-D-manno-octulosonic-acid transferase
MTIQKKANRVSSTWRQTLVRYTYTLLLCVFLPLLIFLLRKRRDQDATGLRRSPLARFGFIKKHHSVNGYLFHCVSVGEVVAASAVIKQLIISEPDVAITISTTTPTGANQAIGLFGDRITHHYLPFDIPVVMNRFLSQIQPKMVVITEVELWPNMIHRCGQKGIPVCVINGRLSARSAHRYKKFSALFLPMFRTLTHICAQGPKDFQNYLSLGVEASKITQTNNIKFDQPRVDLAPDFQFLGLRRGCRHILLGGSTHAPEEDILLTAFKSLVTEYPDLLLILVPRHPERFDAVAQLVEASGLSFCRSKDTDEVSDDCQVLLIDEMGKLNFAYQVSTMAFVGGSIADKGGHNALEAAACALPIMMGPLTYNNPEICAGLKSVGALYTVNSAQDIGALALNWLRNPKSAKASGIAGLTELKRNRGAVVETMKILALYAH